MAMQPANPLGANIEPSLSPNLKFAGHRNEPASDDVSLTYSVQVETIKVHDLVPSRHEFADEKSVRVITCVEFAQGTQFRI